MLASLYSHVRAAAASRAHRLTRPVVSIGNLSMGGRGKTPLAGLVARLLVEAGERPSILSRGYGRQIVDDGVTVVSDGHGVAAGGRAVPARLADLAHAGDEPLMLARAVPGAAVLVAEQRALAGTLAERAFGCTVHVLDDGFQHHQLARDVDIVIVTPDDLGSQPLPFGRLREPVEMLEHADALVVDGAGHTPTRQLAPTHQLTPTYQLTRSIAAPNNPREKVFAVAGIAGPERFFHALTAAGYRVAGTRGFADHHRYSAADIAAIERAATDAGAAAIVTTSKDMVRLESNAAVAMSRVPFVEIPLAVSVEPADAFRGWLLARVAEARR